MTLRNFLALASLVALGFGLAFLLLTGPFTDLYNANLNPGGIFIGQLFGAVLIGFGVLNWLARALTDAPALRTIRLANLIGDAIGFVIALWNQLTLSGLSPLGWSTVATYLLLTVGFAYFQFVKPEVS